jgi:leader peptidase (prepilin peptidase)/N-methyltransferase
LPLAQHIVFIVFVFAFGACVGSFLNVVVWRLPRGQSLVFPRSRCPKCEHALSWRDNIPVFGWIFLRGKCRYCGAAIAARYPIIEAITGLIFVLYYVCFFLLQIGPCAQSVPMMMDEFGRLVPMPRMLMIQRDWPIYALYMFCLAALLAASLIDAETFTIPPSISWWMAGVGIVAHAIIDDRSLPGALNVSPIAGALAVGGAIGLILSIALLRMGLLPLSFAEGTPLLDVEKEALKQKLAEAKDVAFVDYETAPEFTRAQIRREMQKEMLFLIPPMLLGGLFALAVWKIPPLGQWWTSIECYNYLSGALGSILGALIGGFVVWMIRILGSLAFGREAMGLGDADLMFGVGAIIGAGPATLAFFIAPFFGMAIAVYRLITRKGRELPYGPFLALGSAFVMLFYCPMAAYLAPGFQGMGMLLRNRLGID